MSIQSNLRQLGQAFSIYSTSYPSYPPTFYTDSNGSYTWYNEILPSTLTTTSSSGVLYCPNALEYPGPSGSTPVLSWNAPGSVAGTVDYGYNDIGLGGGTNPGVTSWVLPSLQQNNSPLAKSARFSAIKTSTTQMVACDAGINIPGSSAGVAPDGSGYQGWFCVTSWYDASNGVCVPRHHGNLNCLFADGHVDNIKAPDGALDATSGISSPSGTGQYWPGWSYYLNVTIQWDHPNNDYKNFWSRAQ